MSKLEQNSANEMDTCCRHGHGCDLATSDPTPRQLSSHSLTSDTSFRYIKGVNSPTLSDDATVFENLAHPLKTSKWKPQGQKAKSQQKKSDTLIDRFYLGCRTNSGAARALSDRHSLGLYHQIPVTDSQLRRGLQQQKRHFD
ncbi:hypothetical protein M3Y94_01097100 [Aphelenchoides besseyi]|nr:hypothetical protein M3Y94_01097100 [Aphelenchoides besseyi]